MTEINENTKAGTQSLYSATSEFSANEYQIRTTIEKMLTTGFLARIDSCTSSDEGGTKTVNATPLIQQTNAEGVGLPTPSFPVLPHYRAQGGIGAFIVDPVPGDIGVFLAMKADSSGVSSATSKSGVPSSFRKFDPADSMMIATVHTKTPQVWIHIKQDKTIVVHAPAGYTLETNAEVKITASTKVSITAPQVDIVGNVSVSGDVVAHNISLVSHTHGGVVSGGDNTSTPN